MPQSRIVTFSTALLAFAALETRPVAVRAAEGPGAQTADRSSSRFELRPGDVVVFVGGTNVVRAGKAGRLETLLTAHSAAARPRFRDLSWEGDTVFKQGTVAERWRKSALLIRRVAVAALARLGGAEARTALVDLAARRMPSSLRNAAIAALSRVDPEAAAGHAARLFSEARGEDFDPAEVITAFLARQGGSDTLATALAEIELAPGVAEMSLQVLRSAGRSNERLARVLERAVGPRDEIAGSVSYSPELVQALGSAALTYGDARRGEVVFRSRAANCHACHTVGGVGGWAGPDLSAVGTTLPLDRLVEEVMWPKRHVKDGYSLLQVVTQDGEVYQGYEQKERKSRDALLLRELISGDTLRIPRDRIASREEAGTAMPSGLAASLSPSEQRDLLRFLYELGSGRQ